MTLHKPKHPGMYHYPLGWGRIVQELEKELEASPVDVRVFQVKEKFGALRYYVDFGESEPETRERLEAAIERAEELSVSTCQACGAPGRAAGDGWLRTLCERHEKEGS